MNVYFYALACVLTYFLYGNAADNYFFNDDFLWVAMARYDMDVANLFTFRVIGFFRPLINLSFFLTEKTAPGNVAVYHYTSMLFHFFNSVLVFHLMVILFRKRALAFATALYFVVASTHSGAVFWISARTTLLSTFFLLSSFVVLLRFRPSTGGLVVALVLYVLALMAKETSVVGAALVGMLYVYVRDGSDIRYWKRALFFYSVFTLVYFVLRWAAVGGFVQSNWGPGFHTLGNAGGGFLFLFLPWFLDPVVLPLARLLFAATGAFPIELLAVPLLALLVYAGVKTGKKREMLFAVAWILVSLVPASLFKFRFLSQNSFAHDRYYYLASVGACLVVVLLLSMLWESRRTRWAARAAAVVVGLTLAAGDSLRVKLLEIKWDLLSGDFKDTVTAVERNLDRVDDLNTCAIEGPPVPFRYLKYALLLERPRWTLVQVDGGPDAAKAYEPCIYICFTRDGTTYEMRTYKID